MPPLKESEINHIDSFESLLKFLQDRMGWPLDTSATLDDVTFEYTADELRIQEGAASRLSDGVVRQLRDFRPGQPMGIFFVEFNDSQIYATSLRQVLRGLVPNRRQASQRRTWQHENLFFICATANYERFTFAHFSGERQQTAKLSTFGWQRGDRHKRTLIEFNLPPLKWPEDDGADAEAWLAAWLEAFNKEPLTRDFFKRFDTVLDAIKADLEKYQKLPSAEAYTRSQLLLERLIFLYFLQNRGWLSQQRDYLLRSFRAHREYPEKFTYYEGFLEQLFWTLASVPGSDRRLPGIPFLNGGLFDDDEFALTTIRQKRNPPLKIRNATFDRVFDELLEAFNFTVREDTPLNQEVAVDPEMLGKVFESIVLHAEAADPDAVAPDKRKATGSYYTPRIVVHFICKEVLRQYLIARLPGEDFTSRLGAVMEIDASDGLNEEELNRLRELLSPADASKVLPLLAPKCCDPAVGSGAFPVGLLHELVNLRRVVETAANGYVDPVRKEGTSWLHRVKEEIIQDSLYGADIQQQAIEICQLRLWLSLVVDYDLGVDPFTADVTQFKRAIETVSPLPNLEMNFRRGDSLHDHLSGVPLVIHPQYASRYRSDFDFIHKKGLQLHHAQRGDKKRRLRLEILERRLDISQRVLEEERLAWRKERSHFADTLFVHETVSKAEQRRRIEQEVERVEEALKKVTADRKELEKLADQPFDATFYPKLRRLEGADFDSPVNFAWQIDFSDIFAPRRAAPVATVLGEFSFVNEIDRQGAFIENREEAGGFDIIVGNPPFVTARNPVKRELYRERWKRVCKGTYQLVSPFFEMSFGLLRPGGQIGFIVSNAFAKRDIGKPLVENFFPTVNLQEVIDCSGLMFPGHGTPTCIILGCNQRPDKKSPICVAATLPGGGDLRTSPDESPLWIALAEHHNQPGYSDNRIIVANRSRVDMAKHPWNFDASALPTLQLLETSTYFPSTFVSSFGSMFDTHKDEAFILSADIARRHHIEIDALSPFAIGDQIRNWQILGLEHTFVLKPYDAKWKLKKEDKISSLFKYLRMFRRELGSRATFGKGTYDKAGVPWYQYHQMSVEKITAPFSIVYPEIGTHAHFTVQEIGILFPQTAPLLCLNKNTKEQNHLMSGLLNSSSVLFWLKQYCFSKRESEEGATDTYYEFAAGKLGKVPIPNLIAKAFQGKGSLLAEYISKLSQECRAIGGKCLLLSMKKLFEKSGEAYHKWNSSLPGYIPPDASIAEPFDSSHDLRAAFERTIKLRDMLRAEMIARQEEMDWLVYAAYGLIPDAPPKLKDSDLKLSRDERPFRLWAQAEGDFDRAVALIPDDWSATRRKLWQARLSLIRDNEHIRRIEQPVYKRRWDEQWKVGNRWESGQPAYDAEFIEAFDWWLSEKAEWWLEKRKAGGPVTLEGWTEALWADTRVQAAWPVAAEAIYRLALWKYQQKESQGRRMPLLDASQTAFANRFKSLVKEQSVPENIPFAVPWEKIKGAVPANVKRIRGKLNVPRERFRITTAGQYRVAQPL